MERESNSLPSVSRLTPPLELARTGSRVSPLWSWGTRASLCGVLSFDTDTHQDWKSMCFGMVCKGKGANHLGDWISFFQACCVAAAHQTHRGLGWSPTPVTKVRVVLGHPKAGRDTGDMILGWPLGEHRVLAVAHVNSRATSPEVATRPQIHFFLSHLSDVFRSLCE